MFSASILLKALFPPPKQSHSLHANVHLHSEFLHLLRRFPDAAAAIEPLHALSITSPPASPLFAHHALIAAYASSGDLPTARKVFDQMPNRNAISYNTLIAAYSRDRNIVEAWQLVRRMMSVDLRPTSYTFGAILSSPSSGLLLATQIHPLVLKSGLLHCDPFSATALLCLFGRSGRGDDALKLFDEIANPTIVTWNSVISASAQQGFTYDSMFLFQKLLRTGIKTSDCSFVSILSAFRSPNSSAYVEQLHGLVIRTDSSCNLVVANSLLSAYTACSGPWVAEKLFIWLPVRDVISWNTMITTFAKNGSPGRAMDLFFSMPLEESLPNETTFASALSACVNSSVSEYGELIHAKIIKRNLETSVLVSTSLTDFYAKCKSLQDGERIFSQIIDKSVASWNALISGYANESSSTLHLFKEMLFSGFKPNEFSFSSGLKQASASDLCQLHSLIVKMGYDGNEYVSSAIIASYGVCGLVDDALAFQASLPVSPIVSANVIAGIYNREGRYQEAQKFLSHVEDPDAVSWNMLFTACARKGEYLEAFGFFKVMRAAGYPLDKYIAVSLLSVCSKNNSFGMGTLLHGLIIKTNIAHMDVFVHNVLLDMYAKCGSLESCLRVFNGMGERNLISLTALISGLGLHGCAHEALETFKQMESEGYKPDRVAFLTVLSACRHGGLVKEGMLLFESMDVYGIEPEMDHYICLVDLLCQYGCLKEAELVIGRMPFQPNALIWRMYLQGCKKYNSM